MRCRNKRHSVRHRRQRLHKLRSRWPRVQRANVRNPVQRGNVSGRMLCGQHVHGGRSVQLVRLGRSGVQRLRRRRPRLWPRQNVRRSVRPGQLHRLLRCRHEPLPGRLHRLSVRIPRQCVLQLHRRRHNMRHNIDAALVLRPRSLPVRLSNVRRGGHHTPADTAFECLLGIRIDERSRRLHHAE